MKKLILMAFAAFALTVNAQEKTNEEIPQWVKNFKFSGYGMLQYQAEDKEGAEHNELNLRLLLRYHHLIGSICGNLLHGLRLRCVYCLVSHTSAYRFY